MNLVKHILPAWLFLTVAGCSHAPEETYRNAADSPPHPTSSQESPGSVAMPPGMSVGSSGNLTPTPELDAKIAALQKSHAGNKALAAVYADRGYVRMLDDPASPRIKYRMALQDFRSALKLDPSNVKAKTNKDMIEGIYRKMGRPIPQ